MRTVLILSLMTTGLAACGSDDGPSATDDEPRIVVTTSVLGDVVEQLIGEAAAIEVVMPPNANPHDFAASAQQATAMRAADALVVNGLDFEEGLLDTIESAEADGVPVVVAADAIEPIPLSGGHDHDGDEEEEDHDDDEEVDDPHLFTDPVRMREAAELVAAELQVLIPELDTPEVDARVGRYLDELADLDREVEELFADLPEDDRLLVTNHEVFGYFADRYGFELLGAIIPGGSTLAEPSASELAELAEEIEEHDVPAIFVETSSPSRVADALAAEGADVIVVELYSESLGEPGSPGDTYVGMIRTNAERIAAALA